MDHISQILDLANQRNYTILNVDTIESKSTSKITIQCNNCKRLKNPSISDFKRKYNNCRCNMARDNKPLHKIINKCGGIYSKHYGLDKIDDCYQISPEGEVTNVNTRRSLKIYGTDEKFVNLRLKGDTKTEKFSLNVLYACCVLQQPEESGCEIQKIDDTISWTTPQEELNLDDYYVDGEFRIGQADFTDLKNNYPKDVLIKGIMRILQNFKEPIMPNYTEKLINSDYNSILNDSSDVFYRSDNGDTQKIISANCKGLKLLNSVVNSVMISAHKNNKPSYVHTWNDLNTRRLLVERMIDKDVRVNNGSLYGCYGCKYGRLYNFPPNIAKYVYNTYGNKGRILDFCAGYGGRLMGFWVSDCKEYVGIDPNVNVPYDEIARLLSVYEKRKYKVYNACAEDFDYSGLGMFDIVFTSPPYFNTEIYSEDGTQSCHRYKKADVWLEKFLYTTLDKCYKVLKPGGIMAINIKNSGKIDLINPMLTYMEEMGLKEKERICMSQAKRYSNNKTYEYIYIFTKDF